MKKEKNKNEAKERKKKKIKKKRAKKKKSKAKKTAQQSGLLAMSNDIQDLQSMFDLSSLSAKKPLRNSIQKSNQAKRSSVLHIGIAT